MIVSINKRSSQWDVGRTGKRGGRRKGKRERAGRGEGSACYWLLS